MTENIEAKGDKLRQLLNDLALDEFQQEAILKFFADECQTFAPDSESQPPEEGSSSFSVATHEIRASVTAIGLTAEILDRYSDRLTPENKRERIQKIHASLERINTLIDQVKAIWNSEHSKE